MAHIICKVIGHKEFNDEVLAIQPWQDREFASFPLSAFAEEECVRCGETLKANAA